jgi:glutamate-1-semialdehyde 2,1-aminomutase
MTEGIPGSAGVPLESIKNTIIANYNDIENMREIFKTYGNDIAAVIIEPVAGNMGVVPADKEFLIEIRGLCDEYKSLLVFDEVMSGFRVAYKGAASIYGVKPDLVAYAKILGGGLPSGAYGGRKDIMSLLSPLGPVYQAGTMSGNPIVMAAGLATLTKLYNHPEYYEKMEAMGERLEKGIKEIAKSKGISVVVNRCGAMMTTFFTKLDKVRNYEDAKQCDTKLYARFFEHMLKNGINLPPSQFEAYFLSVKHGEKEIDKFLEVMREFSL